MKSSELIKKIKSAGWIEIRQTGSHKIFVHKDFNYSLPVPDHGPKRSGNRNSTCNIEESGAKINLSNSMKKIEIVIEKKDGFFWGRIESKGWMPTPYGKTINEVIKNLKELVTDYVKHEGKNDKVWNKVSWSKVEFEFKYDLVAFFETFDYLNLSAISGKIGINRTLLNHYKTGLKYPSEVQAQKIEDAIHSLATELGKVKLVA